MRLDGVILLGRRRTYTSQCFAGVAGLFGGEEHGDNGTGLAGVLVNHVHLHVEPAMEHGRFLVSLGGYLTALTFWQGSAPGAIDGVLGGDVPVHLLERVILLLHRQLAIPIFPFQLHDNDDEEDDNTTITTNVTSSGRSQC